MDFWHDAAAQKRWLRRLCAADRACCCCPVLVLAVFARPSADDFIYAARTHAVVQQYGLDLPRLLRAAWDTNVYYYENWQGLYVSGFTAGVAARHFRQQILWCHAGLRAAAAVFLPVRGLARCVVLPSGPGAKACCPGHWRCWSDLRLYRGHARPRGGIVLVQRCHELPAVLFAGRAERRAGVCALLCADKLTRTRRKFVLCGSGS